MREGPGTVKAWSPFLQRLRWADQAALTLWLLASTVMLGTLLVSVRRLTRERASWDADTIAGSRVLIAPDFGPALVGVRRPEIIMPAWVRSLPSDAQVAIIAHEDEHRRSGDHYWLAAGRLLLVAMPWNVALWVLWSRFRLAIEFDCDAFKERRVGELEQKAHETAERVRKDGREQLLPAMTPIERRIVHLALADATDVATESRGEGFYKRVAIVKRASQVAAEATPPAS